MEPYRNICGVFAGGGLKGIALAGAAAGAMRRGYHFQRVIGSSSGALVASLVAAGYGPDELRDAVLDIPWPKLADPVPGARIPLVGKHWALLTSRGLHCGDLLERTWRTLLRAKGVRSFRDLPPRSLRMVATDITHQRGVVLPDDLAEYGVRPGRFSVAKAAHMSAAAPFFFRPVRVHDLRRQHVAQFVDGAIATNFPLRIADFDGDCPIVGFRFAAQTGDDTHRTIRGPVSLAAAIITAAIGAPSTLDNPLVRHAALVEIPVQRDPLDFAITPAEAAELFELGHATTLATLRRSAAPLRLAG